MPTHTADNYALAHKKLADLTPDPRNANKGTQRGREMIENSLREYGAGRSILLDRNGRIIAGNKTAENAGAAGLSDVIVVKSDGTKLVAVQRIDLDLDDATAKQLAIADNRAGQVSLDWDVDVLKELATEIDLAPFWSADELENMWPHNADLLTDEDDVPDVPEKAVTKPGDLYVLGRHRLLCGDSTCITDVERLMGERMADMVLTDPPYGMFLDTDFSSIKGSLKSAGRKSGTQGKRYDQVIGDREDFSPELINTIFTALGYCQEMFIFGADYFAELIPNKNDGSWLVWDKRKESQSEAIGAEFELLWSRQKHKRRMLRHDWFGFLSSGNQADARNRVHPTQKPVSLLQDIIDQWGKLTDCVVDLYGGSGSTLIACEKTGRAARLMELDPKYCDVIVQRWQNATGKKAVLDGAAV